MAISPFKLGYAVVNGSLPGDWSQVEEFSAKMPAGQILPSFGLHPWYVTPDPTGWLELLRERLMRVPAAGVGEIGLDGAVTRNLSSQVACFRSQWRLAQELSRTVSVHCVRAWGALLKEMMVGPKFHRPFLLHSYSGPAEMIASFVRLGAYFSFAPAFLRFEQKKRRICFEDIPLQRLVIETDAPFRPPPYEKNAFAMINSLDGLEINHPWNLKTAFEGLVELKKIPSDELIGVLDENFRVLFFQ